MEKQTKAWIAAGTVVAGAAAAASAAHVMTSYLMDMALDRHKPKSLMSSEKARSRIRGTDYQHEFLADVAKASEAVRQTPTERVEIRSRDGICLVGHLRRCEKPRRILLAMHGWRSSWDQDFGLIADFWRDQGCTVLYPDQRGQNESDGDYMGFGMLERFDCADWARWISENLSSTLPIYLVGVSMGASTVLMASALPLPKNVVGIAADCGYTSPQEIFKHITNNNLHLSYGFHSRDIEGQCRRKIRLSPGDISTVSALKYNTRPVMLAHGTEDSFVPVEMTYENYKAIKGPKQLLIVPGADHGMSYYVETEKYQKAVRDFFRLCETQPQGTGADRK